MASSWLVDNERFLPRVGDALDVACGRGRHAFWLAQRGLRTYAIWIPPGEHELTLSYDPAMPWSGEMARLVLRTGRAHRESKAPEGELAIAEQAWLDGNAPDARAAFLPHAADAGAPATSLARDSSHSRSRTRTSLPSSAPTPPTASWC